MSDNIEALKQEVENLKSRLDEIEQLVTQMGSVLAMFAIEKIAEDGNLEDFAAFMGREFQAQHDNQ